MIGNVKNLWIQWGKRMGEVEESIGGDGEKKKEKKNLWIQT